jgi:hypothetical protein
VRSKRVTMAFFRIPRFKNTPSQGFREEFYCVQFPIN